MMRNPDQDAQAAIAAANAERLETEAWKLAQLAATMIAGELASGRDGTPEPADFVRHAQTVLMYARERVALKG